MTVQTHLEHALELAYRYLGHRDRTVAEMRRHLEGKQAEPAAIDGAIAELQELGYLDDERFARCYAQDRRTLDAWGPERIGARLAAAGVAPGLIAQALGDREAEDELQAALEILRRRFPAAPTSDRERERALGLLVRKGYDLELAYDAVRAFSREGA